MQETTYGHPSIERKKMYVRMKHLSTATTTLTRTSGRYFIRDIRNLCARSVDVAKERFSSVLTRGTSSRVEEVRYNRMGHEHIERNFRNRMSKIYDGGESSNGGYVLSHRPDQ